MEEMEDITFRYTRSPIGIISGIALGKEGGIIASYKLGPELDSSYKRGKPYCPVVLTMVCQRRGVKVYDVFDKILSKYTDEGMKSQTGNKDRIRCSWKISKDQMKRVLDEVEQRLQNRSCKDE
ncbi:MAG: hypothetical protein ACOC6H_02355 [Thermoproteota archaeon]